MNLNLVMSTVTRKEDERVRTDNIYIHCYKLLTEAELHTHTHTHTYIYTYIHTHTHIHTYIYIYIYIYIYTHTHTHTCILAAYSALQNSCHESEGETPQFLYFDFLR